MFSPRDRRGGKQPPTEEVQRNDPLDDMAESLPGCHKASAPVSMDDRTAASPTLTTLQHQPWQALTTKAAPTGICGSMLLTAAVTRRGSVQACDAAERRRVSGQVA